MSLNVRQIDSAKPREKAYKLTDGHGLYLFVAPTGAKSWRSNYTTAGKQKTRTYGQYPALSLAEARRAHMAAKGCADVSCQTPKVPSFKTVANDWLIRTLPSLSNPKHRIQVQNTLERYAFPWIGDLPINEITRQQLAAMVIGAQNGIGFDGTQDGNPGKVETAHRVAGRVTAVFDYAQDVGVLPGGHPASHLTRVLSSRRVQTPMPSIPPSEAGKLLLDIDGYPEPITRIGLLLAAHTFVRVNELLGFRTSELREDGAVWVVPAERVKGRGDRRVPHVVPLSIQARKLVEQATAMSGCDLVLSSPAKPGSPLSENTLLFALYRLGYRGRMTVHGFRALASTVLNEQSPFGRDVIERQLAHRETDDVRAAYNRAEYLHQRRELMQWWSDWLSSLLTTSKLPVALLPVNFVL